MNDLWKTIRLGAYVFALPLVATAAASAHQWLTEVNALEMVAVSTPATTEYAGISLHRNHTVSLDASGAINGRVALINGDSKIASGLSGLKVYLTRGGNIVSQVYTDQEGSFVMNRIEPGAYSFIAAGETGFVAYGIHVVEGDSGQANIMEAAAVSPRFLAVHEVLKKYVPQQIAEEILRLAGTDSVTASKVVGAHRVKLDDGQLTGNVVPIFGHHEAVSGTHVSIIQNDVVLAEAQADEKGNFTVSELEPGVYDLVAAGPTGFAAVSFEAISAGQDATNLQVKTDTSIVEQTSQDVVTADIPTTLDVGLASPQDSVFVGEQVQYACDTCSGTIYPDQGYHVEYVGEACGYGCASGGACGGCGNYSGYGACCGAGRFGGGRLLGLAALGLAITALASDGQPSTPGPVSPPMP